MQTSAPCPYVNTHKVDFESRRTLWHEVFDTPFIISMRLFITMHQTFEKKIVYDLVPLRLLLYVEKNEKFSKNNYLEYPSLD